MLAVAQARFVLSIAAQGGQDSVFIGAGNPDRVATVSALLSSWRAQFCPGLIGYRNQPKSTSEFSWRVT